MDGEILDKEFCIEEYINKTEIKADKKIIYMNKDREAGFEELVMFIASCFEDEWDDDKLDKSAVLERQKNAIIGYPAEVQYYKDRIADILKKYHLMNEWYPTYYEDLTEAIFQEKWGLAGVSEWILSKRFKDSSSAKIIGDKIFFFEKGRQVLQPQTISAERRKQLRAALLMNTPKKRPSESYHEVYMLDGTRITIFGEGLTKQGQDCIVFRKFHIKEFSFEKQAELHTIPKEAIPLFRSMINIGFNVAFTGAVRTAKTTFLATWQSYENEKLEGVVVETDPEIPMHSLMPYSPIIQLVAEGEVLEGVVKNIMRSDADYIIMAEARDGIALNIAVKVANKGTRRVKMTFHTTDTIDFCYDVADEIVKIYGGDLYSNIIKVAKSFHYIFNFIQLPDKSKKRLKGIYEIRYDPFEHQISIHQICKYVFWSDDWIWKYDIGEDKEILGQEEDLKALQQFKAELEMLSMKYPMLERSVWIPSYDHLRKKTT